MINNWNYKIRQLLLVLLLIPLFVSGKIADNNDTVPFSVAERWVQFLEYDPNTHRGLPIFRDTDATQPNIRALDHLLHNSFPAQSVRLYYIAQNYLLNTGQIKEIEPLYLVIAQKEGVYTKKGFHLRKENRVRVSKSDYFYIEYFKDEDQPANVPGSFTQAFPHEMGHVLYYMLTKNYETSDPQSQNVPYTSMITDFRTAFAEGFASHFEIISLENEPDLQLRDEIIKNSVDHLKNTKRFLGGYNRDFYLPFRLDYYRISCALWFDTFESYKRIDWVKHHKFKYLSKTANFRNTEKALFFINSGVSADSTKLRNIQQSIATEGVVASFFYELINSKLQDNYLPADFYRQFFNIKNEKFIPENTISPLENQYVKLFYVFDKYLNSPDSVFVPLIAFIEGYMAEYPCEKGVLMRIFEKATGYYYQKDIGPEIWVLNKEHNHGYYLPDQFGGNRSNFYTFNLNTATKEDLQSIKDIKKNEIDSILLYRKQIGYFRYFNDIYNVPGISEKLKLSLSNYHYDKEYVQENVQIMSPYSYYYFGIARLIEKGLFYLMIFIIFYYLMFYNKNDVLKVLTIKYVIRKILKLLILVFLGFSSVVLSDEPLQTFLMVSVLFISVEIILTKRERNRKDAFYTSFFIIVMIMFSVW